MEQIAIVQGNPIVGALPGHQNRVSGQSDLIAGSQLAPNTGTRVVGVVMVGVVRSNVDGIIDGDDLTDAAARAATLEKELGTDG